MKRIIELLLTATICVSTVAQTKELRIERDGFEWYSVSKNGKYGALNFKGEILIPIEYDTITYKPFERYVESSNSGGFKVKKGNALGGYNIDGKCVIPISRNYRGFTKDTNERLGTYYIILLQDGRVGVCNRDGREVFIMNEPDLWITPVLEDGKYYYRFDINGEDEKGIADSKGNVIIKPKYFWVWIENNKFKAYKTGKDAGNDKISTIGSVSDKYDFHNVLSGNGSDNKEQMFRQIGFTPFNGKVEKSTDRLSGKVVYSLEKDRLKGIRDLLGRWIVPMCKDYRLLEIGNRKVYLINDEKSHSGLYSLSGEQILKIDYDAIENAGGNYIKVKRNGSYGIASLDGKEIISTSRGYTSIDFNSSKKIFAVTKIGYTGVCDSEGREISLTKLPPTVNDIMSRGGYASVVELKNGSTKYWKVSKGGRYGLTDAEGKVIVPTEMEALESAGTGFLRYKLNGFWGLMNYTGKIIIDTDRGYTSIGDFKTFNKRFSYTMTGYKGECDATGRQISKIKVETPKQNTSVASSSGSSSSSSSSSTKSSSGNSNSGNNTTTIHVEHHHDPVPVQQWQACWACGGSGKMGCNQCGGSGTVYIGDRLSRCPRCNMRGEIPCNICYGNKGKYITVYQ